ncbi:MAG: metallophosphoesterase family protein [Promethearchaeia archaeon]
MGKRNFYLLIKLIIIFIIILGIFAYGLGVGRYSWPPHDTVQNIYLTLTGSDVIRNPQYTLRNDEIIAYLTWTQNPAETMTIQWISKNNHEGIISYREVGQEEWRSKMAESVHDIPGSEGIYVHWNTLTGLNPETVYEFKLEENPKIRSFRTMPTNPTNIKLAFAGDARDFTFWFEDLTQSIGNYSPHLLVGKGDYVACEGIPNADNTKLWLYFLKTLEKSLINENGEMIPFILAMGNHEVDTGEQYEAPNKPEEAEYMWSLFKSPRKLPPENEFYGALNFGDYLQLIILDSIHTAPIVGAQTDWLKSSIDPGKQHIIPVYHSAIFPSTKDFYSGWKIEMRELWLPLFYENNVKVVMEACDHNYKRTVPIEFALQLPDGVTNYISLNDGYLFEGNDGMVFYGDGGWGVRIRDIYNPKTTWYLEDAIGSVIKPGMKSMQQPRVDSHPDDGKEIEKKENAYHFFGVELEGAKITVNL